MRGRCVGKAARCQRTGVGVRRIPNLVAYIALFAWPFLALFLYRHLKLQQALAWSILGAYLLLPVKTTVDLPAIPAFDKVLIPSVSAYLLCRWTTGKRIRLFPEHKPSRLLLVLFLGSPFLTVLMNEAPVVLLDRTLPGLSLYDAVSIFIRQLILIVPFILGRQFLATEEGHRTLLRVLVVAGLIYSLPMLFEVRMSPQLHTWFYGFFPHSFAQAYRDGGFRPVVFLGHGLAVAFFAMMATVAAAALWRSGERIGKVSTALVTVYLAIVLFLCKSLASLLYGTAGILFVRFASLRIQMLFAVALVTIALFYPMMRGAGFVPVDTMLEMAESIDAARAGSLKFRFDNEEKLLAHANRRPIFGWGSWGRNRAFEGSAGDEEAVTDGFWVITIGLFGWVGYIGQFGLLAMPVLLLLKSLRRDGAAVSSETAALCCIFAFNVIDLIPNSSISPWTWLVAGSLLGLAERRRNAIMQ